MLEPYGIAAFRSRQQVLRFENILRRAGVPAHVISTPRDVSIGCGLSVKFSPEYWDDVCSVYSRNRLDNLIGFYHVEPTGGRAKLTPMCQFRD